MKAIIIVVLLLMGVLVIATRANEAASVEAVARPQNSVTLQAAPGNTEVQMFEHVGSGDEGKVSRFPDGASCTKFGGPTPVSVEGISMSFYRLTCNGVTGYVNVKWVD
jgi:hypothetical protein